MKGLVFAAIAPHGAMAIPEAKPKDDPTLASATTAGMVELGRRFAAARPDVAIILTPHNVHVEGAMAVVDAGALAGISCSGAARSRSACRSTATSPSPCVMRFAQRASPSSP